MKKLILFFSLFISITLQAQLRPGGSLSVFPHKYNNQIEEFEMQGSSIILTVQSKSITLVKKDLVLDLTVDEKTYEFVDGFPTTFYECSTESGGFVLFSITQEGRDSYILSVTYEEDNTLIYRGNKWR